MGYHAQQFDERIPDPTPGTGCGDRQADGHHDR